MEIMRISCAFAKSLLQMRSSPENSTPWTRNTTLSSRSCSMRSGSLWLRRCQKTQDRISGERRSSVLRKRIKPSFRRFENSRNLEVLLRHGLSFRRFENYQNAKDPPTNTNHEHESRSVLLRKVFLSPPELADAITTNAAKGRLRRIALCRILQLYASDPGLLWALG
jgi:hypothetical protein